MPIRSTQRRSQRGRQMRHPRGPPAEIHPGGAALRAVEGSGTDTSAPAEPRMSLPQPPSVPPTFPRPPQLRPSFLLLAPALGRPTAAFRAPLSAARGTTRPAQPRSPRTCAGGARSSTRSSSSSESSAAGPLMARACRGHSAGSGGAKLSPERRRGRAGTRTRFPPRRPLPARGGRTGTGRGVGGPGSASGSCAAPCRYAGLPLLRQRRGSDAQRHAGGEGERAQIPPPDPADYDIAPYDLQRASISR